MEFLFRSAPHLKREFAGSTMFMSGQFSFAVCEAGGHKLVHTFIVIVLFKFQ